METTISIGKPHRAAGWMAIASGLIGIIGAAFLITFLTGHLKSVSDDEFFLVRIHDGCVVIQFLLMIRFLFALRDVPNQQSTRMSQVQFRIGVAALSFTILFLLLNFPKVLADVLYMVPQGIFGIWLTVACLQKQGDIPGGVRWFGIIVGIGLGLVGLYPIGYALLVDSILLQIPAPSNESLANVPMTTTNAILHIMLMIGSLLGVFPLPIWTILLGGRLISGKIPAKAPHFRGN
ncbi:hypothetical protein ACPPVU_11800 [Mucilaginibacter sp. McL0603]|uniref:hypothetical protein n=1 Tax=Mucilaginibacter sp. McL0603 TaxID=3415670 RepID=UPI003CF44876